MQELQVWLPNDTDPLLRRRNSLLLSRQLHAQLRFGSVGYNGRITTGLNLVRYGLRGKNEGIWGVPANSRSVWVK